MSTIKRGKHIRLKDTAAKPAEATIRLMPYLSKDTAYLVTAVQDMGEGRRRVYFEVPGREEWACLWSAYAAALPRCLTCDSELHKTPKLDKNGEPKPCPDDGPNP